MEVIMAKTKVCVIFGGMSNEHEVSLMSTKSVIDNIPADKYDVVKVGITKKGRWLFFPGCGIDTAKAVEKVNAKRIVFGHLWELSHWPGHRGRLDERLIRPRLAEATAAGCKDTSVAFWGDRIV